MYMFEIIQFVEFVVYLTKFCLKIVISVVSATYWETSEACFALVIMNVR